MQYKLQNFNYHYNKITSKHNNLAVLSTEEKVNEQKLSVENYIDCSHFWAIMHKVGLWRAFNFGKLKLDLSIRPRTTAVASRARRRRRRRSPLHPSMGLPSNSSPQGVPLTYEFLVNTRGKAGHLRSRPSDRLWTIGKNENSHSTSPLPSVAHNTGEMTETKWPPREGI